MPRYLELGNTPQMPARGNKMTLNERRDHYRGRLKIRTPAVSDELRKRWYGMPPTKLTIERRGGTLAF